MTYKQFITIHIYHSTFTNNIKVLSGAERLDNFKNRIRMKISFSGNNRPRIRYTNIYTVTFEIHLIAI